MAENLVLLLFVILPLVLLIVTRRFFRDIRSKLQAGKVRAVLSGSLLVVLSLLSIGVLSGEIYLRFADDSTDTFAVRKTSRQWFDRHVHRNENKSRDSIDYVPAIAENHRRITFLGDSFTFGHGIANVEDRFVNLVRAQLTDTEVHALAECGWDTGRQLSLLHFFADDEYETDIVVLVYSLNDITDIAPCWQEVLERFEKLPQPGFLAIHSYLFNTIAAPEPDITDYYNCIRKAYDSDDVWKRQRLRLTNFRNTTVERGAEFYVVTTPLLHAVGADYPFRDVHQRLDELWTDLEVPHLDLLDVYSDNSPDELMLNPRDVHHNEFAHALAGRAIVAFLEKQLTP